MADDGDRRRNPPPLPSTYVTLVQLQERWIQEKQRKKREKEEREEQERQLKIQKEQQEEESEKRKRQEEEVDQRQQQRRANLQKSPVQSTTTTTDFPRRNHRRPPLKSSVQYWAVRVSDGESKRTDDLRKDWKMKGKPRADEEEDVVDEIPVVSIEKERVTSNKWKKWGKGRVEEDLMSGCKEQLLYEKEGAVDEIPVVSTERDCCEKERVTSNRWKKWGSKRGKARVEEDLDIGRERLSLEEVEAAESVVPVVSTERRSGKEIGGKCEERVSGSGGKRRNVRYRRGVKNGGNDKRVEEVNLVSIGGEEVLPKKEVEAAENVVPVVSTERRSTGKETGRKCEEEGVSAGGGKKGNGRYYRGVKNRGNDKRVGEEDLMSIGREEVLLKKEVEAENVTVVVSTERRSCGNEVGGKCEEEEGVSASGGKKGNGRYQRGVKIRGNDKRVEEEDLVSVGREEVLPKEEVNAENVAVVVSTEREGGGLLEGNGRNLVVNGGWVWEKKVVGDMVVDRSERVLGKFECLSVRGEGGYGRNAGNVNGAPGRYRLSYGRGSGRKLPRPRDSNLVWVRKEEGDTSDANVVVV